MTYNTLKPKASKLFTKVRQYNQYITLTYRFAVMLFIYAICRLLFFGFNAHLFPNSELKDLPYLMLGGLKFDISALLYINALFLLLSITPLPLKWKSSSAYQTVTKYVFYTFNTVALAFNCIDIIYYRFIFKRTTASVFSIVSNEDNMFELWMQFFMDYWYVLMLFIGLIVVMVYLYNRVKVVYYPYKNAGRYYLSASLALVLIAALALVGIRGGVTNPKPLGLGEASIFTKSPNELAIVLNTPFCILRTLDKTTLQRKTYFTDDKQLEAVYNPIKQYHQNKLFNNKNVVIIILESFSKEYVGALNSHLDGGHYNGYTPFLDSLIHNGLVYTNAYANGLKSIDALPAITASLPAYEIPLSVSEYGSNNIKGLPQILHEEGYQTAFFHAATNGSMRFDAFSSQVGFRHYYGRNEFNNDAEFDGTWGIFDEPFFNFFATETSQLHEPFLATIFTLSSHHPYTIPDKYRGKFPKGPSPFNEAVAYSDNALRLYFNQAKKQSWYQNTLFVLMADHSTAPVNEVYNNDKDAFAIPILFFTPDGSLKGQDHSVAQQADIMPTVLYLLGYNKPFFSFGQNLFGNKKERFVVNYKNDLFQMVTDSTFIRFDGTRVTEIYDIKKDPSLQQNLINTLPFDAEEQTIKAYLQQYNNRMIDNKLTAPLSINK